MVEVFGFAEVTKDDVGTQITEFRYKLPNLRTKFTKFGGRDGTIGNGIDVSGAVFQWIVITIGSLGNAASSGIVDGLDNEGVVDMSLKTGEVFGINNEFGTGLGNKGGAVNDTGRCRTDIGNIAVGTIIILSNDIVMAGSPLIDCDGCCFGWFGGIAI